MQDRYPKIGTEILAWYRRSKRDLPWRHTKDPYKIWVSEIMLQQTRVDTVIEYYLRFLQRFPDIRALAEAEEQEVLAAWQGLGYYSRARNLQKAAGIVKDQYDGGFPARLEEVRKLPGVGDYTAAAILSIALGQPHAAVDGNVLRVVARLEQLEEDILLPRTKKQVTELVEQMIPSEAPGDFTQGMMELGALVCIPGQPLCGECPVQEMCGANRTGRQAELPVRSTRKEPLPEYRWQVAVVLDEGRILLEHRKEASLLGHMWGLPMVEEQDGQAPEDAFMKRYGMNLACRRKLGCASHTFSHQRWKMIAAVYMLVEKKPLPATLQWVEKERLKDFGIPTAFRRVLKLLDSEEKWEQMELI